VGSQAYGPAQQDFQVASRIHLPIVMRNYR